ncbi:hypothetical protein DVH26_07000 [Paenibacillus sp. H1-7]|nr:hypothetical protein DVH26_07000 [Paenibacillus sp. H1-7]
MATSKVHRWEERVGPDRFAKAKAVRTRLPVVRERAGAGSEAARLGSRSSRGCFAAQSLLWTRLTLEQKLKHENTKPSFEGLFNKKGFGLPNQSLSY